MRPSLHFETQMLILVTDANGNSIGCVLQQAKNGVTVPLAFWSKGLTQAQRNWSVFEKELFACYASLRYFRYYLEAKNFVLRTDHRPIVAKFYSSLILELHHLVKNASLTLSAR